MSLTASAQQEEKVSCFAKIFAELAEWSEQERCERLYFARLLNFNFCLINLTFVEDVETFDSDPLVCPSLCLWRFSIASK